MPICPECPNEVRLVAYDKQGNPMFYCDECKKHFFIINEEVSAEVVFLDTGVKNALSKVP